MLIEEGYEIHKRERANSRTKKRLRLSLGQSLTLYGSDIWRHSIVTTCEGEQGIDQIRQQMNAPHKLADRVEVGGLNGFGQKTGS